MKEIIIDGEHDMNYCEDNNCKHYGNKEQCEKTHCYYRCYSKLYTQLKTENLYLKECQVKDLKEIDKLKAKEQECEELKFQNKRLDEVASYWHKRIFKVERSERKLKAENEELKKQYNCYACGTCNGKEDYRNLERHHIGLRKSFDELHKQLDQLKAENEKLKEENEELKTLFNDDYFQGLDIKTIIELAKKSIRITAYNRKLENTLEEIREINKEFFDMNYGFDEQGISEDVQGVAREIQDKINEVLNGR